MKRLFFFCVLLHCVQAFYAQIGESKPVSVTCPICVGKGGCMMCAGSGYIYSVMGMSPCPICFGNGKCSSCHGMGHIFRLYDPNIDYTRGSNKNSSGTSTTEKRDGYQKSRHQCRVCGGTGEQIKEPWMGSGSGDSKWCKKCKKHVYVTHQHVTCSNCRGKGYSDY